MTTEEMETQYENCANLIRQAVGRFMRIANIPARMSDELLSQANLFFVVAADSYDGEIAEFTTWVTIQITGRLRREWELERREWTRIHNPVERFVYKVITQSPILWLDELSQDSKILLGMAYAGDFDLDELIFTKAGTLRKRLGMKYIFRYLRNLGWSRIRIRHCFQNLRTLLVE